MTQEHTPGPWGVECSPYWPFDFTISGPNIAVGRIAYSTQQKTIDDVREAVGFPHKNREGIKAQIARQEADVLLAATAPELLEALDRLYNAIDCNAVLTPELLQECKAVIAKATGK